MAEPWTEIADGPHDVRLVVCDMDGTLLRGTGRIPETFWPLMREMRRRGITFVPASGRQHATLVKLFGADGGTSDRDALSDTSYIAENGNLVTHRGRVLSTTTVDGDAVDEVVKIVRSARRAAAGPAASLDLVLCGVRSAYIERDDHAFVTEARKYYAELEVVDDVLAVADDILKVAVVDFVDAEQSAKALFGPVAKAHQVVVSGRHWIDIMHPEIHKGRGVRALQHELDIDAESTVVFGDYLNDLEMLETGNWSFAMANAHPDIKNAARFLAPANTEDGVVTVLRHLLGE